ncbi:carboxypeptidase regulatory-like domain-containing protein [Exilibacterium tricleocarpae]|uniref:Carboxypeptidase regulatory-like domain-containing protein n=2 Tax=Exilibacterium tricleocarpae TaxID=2591008 RepID=A0A545SPQ1_9GAMM|nr:carboxypeptidase regulatory-like domain-containing protein [Exilibacterium tricleocarpae]
MSIFDVGKACVFSEVSGVVTYRGEPVPGATVRRIAKWQKEKQDSTTTDADGRFHFEPMYQRSAVKLIPAEFVAHQRLLIEHQGEEVLLWFTTKRSTEENSELNGKPLKFTCELTNEPRFDRNYRASIKTLCTWD